MERQTLSIDEAAAILGISRNTAYRAAKRGEIKTIRIGDRLLVLRSFIDRILTSTREDEPENEDHVTHTV